MCLLSSLTEACPKQQFVGLEVKFYYQCACNIDQDVDLTDGATPSALPTFDGGAGWFSGKMLVDTGGINWTMVGDVGGQGLKTMGKFFILGDEQEQLDFAKNLVASSGSLTMLFRRVDKSFRLIGTGAIPAYVEAVEGAVPVKLGDGRIGTEFTVAANHHPIFFPKTITPA